jgi:PIN domain nuclease of toxin-antitoxin system
VCTFDLKSLLAASAYWPLSIHSEHVQAVASLNWQHRDPFDRILAAQSQIESIPLVTADPVFRR